MVERCRTYRDENGSMSHDLMSEEEFKRRHYPSSNCTTKPGHIRVMLDFIPVEERIPESDGSYYVRVAGYPLEQPVEVVWADGVWSYSTEVSYRQDDVTHWAEIPVVEANDV